MKIFVAGATGVVGWRAVRALVATGHEVAGVARSEAKAQLLRDLGADPVSVDLFDGAAVRSATSNAEAVVNLATRIPPTSKAWRTGAWKENNRIRTEAAATLAAAAAGVGARFVQESITFPYADAGVDWIGESHPFDATSLVTSVLDAEASAARVTAAGGRGIVLRFAMFYGSDSAHTLEAIKAARFGVAAAVGHPDAFQSFISTEDAATAVVAALDAPAGIYNVVDDEPLPRGDAWRALGQAVGKRALRFGPAKAIAAAGGSKADLLARSQRVSNRKFRSATPWVPAIPSVREGWPQVVHEVGDGG
ncbi:MAG TPA: NAD-dependent epimerase/dehydratase family protein [Acidimicrobiales bacterium]|nr:NAD-dependent epimerase/dehydratase family protein [Acidimicrobiales bacterium]